MIVLVYSVFYNGPLVLQSTEYVLQVTIESLTNFRLYIGGKPVKNIQLPLQEDHRQKKVNSRRNKEGCLEHSYRTRIIHRNPLIIYIENFLTENEINHLIKLV